MDGTLDILGGSAHTLGIVAGSGSIYIPGTTNYTIVSSGDFTGKWILGNAPVPTPAPSPGSTGSGGPTRPAPTGGLTMNGTIEIQGDESRVTNRVMNLSGDGTAIIISDWTGHDTIHVHNGVTLNLGLTARRTPSKRRWSKPIPTPP